MTRQYLKPILTINPNSILPTTDFTMSLAVFGSFPKALDPRVMITQESQLLFKKICLWFVLIVMEKKLKTYI